MPTDRRRKPAHDPHNRRPKHYIKDIPLTALDAILAPKKARFATNRLDCAHKVCEDHRKDDMSYEQHTVAALDRVNQIVEHL